MTTPDELRALHARLCGGATTRPRPDTAAGASAPPGRKRRLAYSKTIWAQITVFVGAAGPVSAMEPSLLQSVCLGLIALGVLITIYDRVRYWREGRA